MPEGRRLLQRYIGHCNIQTDIKEVTFLCDNDELVAAGMIPRSYFLLHSACSTILSLDYYDRLLNVLIAAASSLSQVSRLQGRLWQDDLVNVSRLNCECLEVMLGAESDDQTQTSDQP